MQRVYSITCMRRREETQRAEQKRTCSKRAVRAEWNSTQRLPVQTVNLQGQPGPKVESRGSRWDSCCALAATMTLSFHCRRSSSQVLSLIAVLVAYLWSFKTRAQDIQDREPSLGKWSNETLWFRYFMVLHYSSFFFLHKYDSIYVYIYVYCIYKYMMYLCNDTIIHIPI